VLGKSDAAKYSFSVYGPLASNPNATIASELQYDSDGKAQVAVGTNYKLDSGSSVKSRINSRGIFGLVYSQRIQDAFTFSFLADFNIREIDHPNSAKFGIKVAL